MKDKKDSMRNHCEYANQNANQKRRIAQETSGKNTNTTWARTRILIRTKLEMKDQGPTRKDEE